MTNRQKIVILGGGFAGLRMARELIASNYDVVLIDKNNYHQFQPLFYQVATAGLEPSAIAFPFRKLFQKATNVIVRVAEVESVDTVTKSVHTSIGDFSYDHLVIAIGADTNFFGNANLTKYALPMKSVGEALGLRNRVLQNFEDALIEKDKAKRRDLLDIVVVGGGPTGVEVAGALADMRRFILPKDYPELDFADMDIYLLEGSDKTLGMMSEEASKKSREFLEKLGVKVLTNARVQEYDGKYVQLADGEKIRTNTLIWAAGIKGNAIVGIKPENIVRGGRIKVNRFNKIEGEDAVYVLGDLAYMETEKYPQGHPQVANVAITQGALLAKNFKASLKNKDWKQYEYHDIGSMATIGRNLAVVDFPYIKFQGFFAWLIWMFVHLMLILGVKNKLLIFINWAWNYITFDQSLRLILTPKTKKTIPEPSVQEAHPIS